MGRPKTVSAPLLATILVDANITQVDANTTSDVQFDVPGSRPGHPVVAWVEDATNPLDAGLGVVGAWCDSKDHVTLRFMNTTGSNVTPGATDIKIVQF